MPNLTVGVDLLLLLAAVFAFFGLVGRLLDLLRPRRVFAQLVGAPASRACDVYPSARR